jgi:hypothetical protein
MMSFFNAYLNKDFREKLSSRFRVKRALRQANNSELIIREHLRRKDKPEIDRNNTRIFLAIKIVNWEKIGLVDSWCDVAECVHYDWSNEFDQYSKNWYGTEKVSFNKKLIETVRQAHQSKKIAMFFSYLSGRWVFPETITEIGSWGIITVNISLDDNHAFWGDKEHNGFTGVAEIATAYDICITTQSVIDIIKYENIGARPLFLPPGGNPKFWAQCHPTSERAIAVSFVGQNYGKRDELIRYLRENGIQVVTRGTGWTNGPVTNEEMLKTYYDSLVTLGFGYTSRMNRIALKGRDFEVPMSGTAYITTANPELEKYFVEGREILFYKNAKDLFEKVTFCIRNPQEAIKIGVAGRERALREHSWQQRWRTLLEICG